MRALVLALLAGPAAAQVVPGEAYSASVPCGDATVALKVDPAAETATLFVEASQLHLPYGPSYMGPVCVTWNGAPHAGFTEFMGNAYETYRVVDLMTLQATEIPYEEAEALGWWD